jgi:hypothetical protein
MGTNIANCPFYGLPQNVTKLRIAIIVIRLPHQRGNSMNFNKPHFSIPILLLLSLLLACSPIAAPAKPAPVQNTATAIPNTPANILPTATLEPSPTFTSTPEADPIVFPYYLPLAIKPEVEPQTINGVTVSIDWAYADEGRIALHYTISGLDWPEGTYMDPMQEIQITSPSIPDLWMGGGGNNRSLVEQGTITGEVDQRLVDGALDAQKNPNIRVNVNIPVEGPTKIGTFPFKLDLPVLEGTRIENIDQTVVANNVAMTLKSTRLTPSYMEALICFQMPSAVDWGLTASILSIGGKDYSYSSGGMMQGAEGKSFRLTDPERCSSIGFDIIQDESANALTLSVPSLMGSVPEIIDQERVDRANQRLADSGIEFQYANVDHGGNIEVLKRPEGKTDQEIYPLIWNALADQYEGPWLFTVPVQR